ncbi:MAG: hypothetical protein ACLP4R_30665, partial [Solirubrobacteraceae bacterium]
MVSGAILALGVGGGAAAASSTPTGRAGRPDRPLLAVSCSSAQDCTAVGGLFAAHLNGRRWSIQRIAVPSYEEMTGGQISYDLR